MNNLTEARGLSRSSSDGQPPPCGSVAFASTAFGVHLQNNKTSKSESASTSLGCSPAVTQFVDSAGCPNVKNTTYTTPAPSVEFRVACAINFTSSQGEDIELANVTTSTLDDCLASCARYNNGQCLAAT
ncbi:hypothetical protein DSL72_001903 [Monilinia vaccinii-corymbosi]|uniref:Apple domain-containing protein n=1 Tax=Monilinia vaccinii-corymbosi TaxID=61207 RepID=A0A8A3PB52_9HELO|nr:hypothetical protein DSL72_001903 [Monilinia vaccinii-corymbosi]